VPRVNSPIYNSPCMMPNKTPATPSMQTQNKSDPTPKASPTVIVLTTPPINHQLIFQTNIILI